MGPRRVVLHMQDRRPVWAMPDWVPRELAAALPAGWELLVLDEPNDGSGDGAARVTPEVLEAVRDAEVYLGHGIPAEVLEAGPGLRWVHSGAAGVGGSLGEAMLRRDVIFTNSAGIHGPPIAETVLAMILYFLRCLDFAVAGQRRRSWWTEPYYEASSPIRELSESVVGVVGFGGIGREVSRRVASLGARVIATKRTAPRAGEAELAPVAGGGSLASAIELLHGPAGLDRALRESDVVVLALPETGDSRGLIDADALARMRPGAALVNVARGRVVDEDALVEALVAGRLRGAGLDVFAREPLPEDHPLWGLENTLLTPHVSAVTRGYWRRETDLIVRNLERHLAGAPPSAWENVVDREAGY